MSKQIKYIKSKVKDFSLKLNKKNKNVQSAEMSILVGISQLMH